ncbi:hypothetical protein Pelo_13397 [Pelomyxa schiedti]|nr:hypothetical protein Pelo_13397 [Pelomyxa schiedti]
MSDLIVCGIEHAQQFEPFSADLAMGPFQIQMNEIMQDLVKKYVSITNGICVVVDSGFATTSMMLRQILPDAFIVGISGNQSDAHALASSGFCDMVRHDTFECSMRSCRKEWLGQVTCVFADLDGLFWGTSVLDVMSSPRTDLENIVKSGMLACITLCYYLILVYTRQESHKDIECMAQIIHALMMSLGEKYGYIVTFAAKASRGSKKELELPTHYYWTMVLVSSSNSKN